MAIINKIKTYFLNSSNSYVFYKNYYQSSLDKFESLENNQEKILSKLNSIDNFKGELHNFSEINKDFNEKIVEIMRNHYIVTAELKSQIDNICYQLKQIDFNSQNEEEIELLNKQINLIYLNLQEFSLKLDKTDTEVKNNFRSIQSNVNDISNQLEYTLNYQKYANTLSKENNKNPHRADNYLISIIMPLYNIEKSFVMRAFNSITRQTIGFENLEVIFIDDNSTFNEGTIFANELSQMYNNVKYFNLKINSGTGQARNVGLKHSTGKYVMFLDQDDLYLPNSCEILYNQIEQNNADMACGNYINLSRDGSEKVDWSMFDINDYMIISENIDEYMNLFKVDPSIWSKIYRKDFLDSNNIKFCDFRGGDDLLFYHETLFKSKKFVNINEPIVVYEQRINKNEDKISFSLNNSFEALKDLMEIYVLDFKLFKENNESYVDMPLKNNLNYFALRRLKNSILSHDEFLDLIDIGKEMFDYFVENDIETVPYFRKMFNYIAEDDMDNAYLEYKKIIKG